MRGTRLAVIAALALTAAPAQAGVIVRLGLGADYWVDDRGAFDVTLAVGAFVAPHLQIGGRFGALITTTPNTVGAPIDFFLRVPLANSRVYLEGLVGPWILFNDPERSDPLRLHAAFGFGLHAGVVSFGLEVGYMDPFATVGVRVAFALF